MMLKYRASEQVRILQQTIAELDLSSCCMPQEAMQTFIAHLRRKGVPLKAAVQAWACHPPVLARKEKKTLRKKIRSERRAARKQSKLAKKLKYVAGREGTVNLKRCALL